MSSEKLSIFLPFLYTETRMATCSFLKEFSTSYQFLLHSPKSGNETEADKLNNVFHNTQGGGGGGRVSVNNSRSTAVDLTPFSRSIGPIFYKFDIYM